MKCGVPFGYFAMGPASEDAIRKESETTHLCGKCLKGHYVFNKARSVALYQGVIREMIHAFKYEGNLKIAGTLAETIIMHMPFNMEDIDILVPVPLYIGKLRQREYNQSSVLATEISRRTSVPVSLMGLARIRDTLPQIEIRDEAARRRNVRGAFQARDKSAFQGCSALLIDDVFTTGSTSNECAKTLLKSGASSVDVLTLARAKSI